MKTLLILLATLPLLFAQEDARPVVDDKSVPVEKAGNSSLPTLWIAGDSTVRSSGAMRGWGQEIGAFFDPAKIQVVNRAIGGRSSRTFQAEGKWDSILSAIKPGDLVLVQFGHNDVGPLDARGKFRGSLRSEGEETQSVEKPDGSVEIVHSFGWYLRKYASDAKAKGATPILLSPVPHKDWKEGKIRRNTTYTSWTRNAAAATGAFFIDLNGIVAKDYEELGPETVETLFADARTHTNAEGANFNARAVVAGIKGLPACRLAESLSPAADSIPASPTNSNPQP